MTTITAEAHEAQARQHDVEADKIDSTSDIEDFVVQAHEAASEAHDAAANARRAADSSSNEPNGLAVAAKAQEVAVFAATATLAAWGASSANTLGNEFRCSRALDRAYNANDNAQEASFVAEELANEGL